ncbi:nitroimidazol reductase NimA-like FMN-containing flavoprotein (pyridoxamine 5'-phosphate oxidase superfamily) [Bacilli bacterium PM5-9]|nr:nitroimidazol reductase NimA-like FMN-containing flavoprotein (pyridoxamine 5'-phosphate oxidase superfamily) [Bacilli bacterium PM5-9]
MRNEIRRKDREISYDEAYNVLLNAEYGTLSLVDGDFAYAIPMSFAIKDNVVYFHSAMEGSKITIMNTNQNACFSVVGKTMPIYNKQFTTYYESAIIHSKIVFVNDDDEKIEALRLLCQKYLPNDMDKFEAAIKMSLSRTNVFKMNIELLKGKRKGNI